MTEQEIAFKVALWNAISRWAKGDTGQMIEAVTDVNRLILKWSEASFDRFQEEVAAWQAVTFPESTKKTVLTHLRRELGELEKSDSPSELADILHLLIAYASKLGVSLMGETRRKFAENKNRKWGEPDEEGVREHVRSDDEA